MNTTTIAPQNADQLGTAIFQQEILRQDDVVREKLTAILASGDVRLTGDPDNYERNQRRLVIKRRDIELADRSKPVHIDYFIDLSRGIRNLRQRGTLSARMNRAFETLEFRIYNQAMGDLRAWRAKPRVSVCNALVAAPNRSIVPLFPPVTLSAPLKPIRTILMLPAPAPVLALPRSTVIRGELKRLYDELIHLISWQRNRVWDDTLHGLPGGINIGTPDIHYTVAIDDRGEVVIQQYLGTMEVEQPHRYPVQFSPRNLAHLVRLISHRVLADTQGDFSILEQRETAELVPPEGEGWRYSSVRLNPRTGQKARIWSRFVFGGPGLSTATAAEQPTRPPRRKPAHLLESERFLADLAAEITHLSGSLKVRYTFQGECFITASDGAKLHVTANTGPVRLGSQVYQFRPRDFGWLRQVTEPLVVSHNDTVPAEEKDGRRCLATESP